MPSAGDGQTDERPHLVAIQREVDLDFLHPSYMRDSWRNKLPIASIGGRLSIECHFFTKSLAISASLWG